MDTALNEPTNNFQYKSQRLLNQRIRKRYYTTLGTSVINSLMFTPSIFSTVFYNSILCPHVRKLNWNLDMKNKDQGKLKQKLSENYLVIIHLSCD